MIFITAKFKGRAEHAESWADLTREFTEATRSEPGNLWFDWSRRLDDPTETPGGRGQASQAITPHQNGVTIRSALRTPTARS